MGSPYVGEIRMFGFNFAPVGWMACAGQILSIAGNETLFTLIGTTYGGDGQTTFALPDLQGRIPIGMGQGGGLSNRTIGQESGVETVTLTVNQIPAHTHLMNANANPGNAEAPTNAYPAKAVPGGANAYTTSPNTTVNMSPNMVTSIGGSQPHDNMMPFLTVNFCISLFGIFPSQG